MKKNLIHNTYSIHTDNNAIIFVKFVGSMYSDLSEELCTIAHGHPNVKKIHIYLDFGSKYCLPDYELQKISFVNDVLNQCDYSADFLINNDNNHRVKIYIHMIGEKLDGIINFMELKNAKMNHAVNIINMKNYDEYACSLGKITILPFYNYDKYVNIGIVYDSKKVVIEKLEKREKVKIYTPSYNELDSFEVDFND